MRKSFGAKAILYPMPVLILGSYGIDGTPNAMNAAWGGISEETEISICISEEHKTTENILERRAFTVGVADVDNVEKCDYVGIVSGNKTPEKMERVGWTVTKSALVDAPIFEELPLCLECELLSYDPTSCRLVGRIVNVSIDERVLGEDGKPDFERFRPISYDPISHTYREIGAIVGKAFSDGLKLK